jgi:hypothetical protein
MFCSSLNAKGLDKQARTGAGARAPSLDEQDDHVKEGESLLLGEAELTSFCHPDLPRAEGSLKPSIPGTKLPMRARLQRDIRPFTREYFFEDRTEVALVG